MTLTLGEILDHPSFGLELRTSDTEARDRIVGGVHCLELVDPVPWLQEGWVMMTAGAQLRGDVEAQRLVVERAEEGGIAAIGVGLKAFVPDVPIALLDEAEKRSFPVFSAPYDTPFREIVQYVNQSLLSHDLYVFRRLAWMQQYLLHALHEPNAIQAVLDRLSGLMGNATVGCIRPGGATIATNGAIPGWVEIAGHCDPDRMAEAEIEGRWGIIAPVTIQDRPDCWLVVVARSEPLDRALTKPLVETAINLLALFFSTQRNATHSRKEMRRRLAARFAQRGPGERDDPVLAGELAAVGIDFTNPCRVVLASFDGHDSAPSAEKILDHLDDAIEGDRIDAVACSLNDHLLVLAQGEVDGVGGWFEATGIGNCAVGVSEPLQRIEAAWAAIDQAKVALAMTSASDRPGIVVCRHEELGPEVLLVSEVRSTGARDALAGILQPLQCNPSLLLAVEAYLAADLDVGRAAAALHLHRNSLRNRLTRAEELLGRPLKSPATIAILHLGLIASKL